MLGYECRQLVCNQPYCQHRGWELQVIQAAAAQLAQSVQSSALKVQQQQQSPQSQAGNASQSTAAAQTPSRLGVACLEVA